MNDTQCSDLFSEIFDSHCGGIVRHCACGRTHFNFMEPYNFDEGELERLESKAKSDPEHFVARDCIVSCMEINGLEIVDGCVCDTAKKYENFIRSHSGKLAAYLNAYAEQLRAKAKTCDVAG